jgi:tRNA pseudouridine55 synthase
LPLALGEATKTVPYMMDGRKSYGFTVLWGQERDTDDIEGQVSAVSDKRPGINEINSILQEFTGRIQQVPPQYSAIKVGGKRAYDLARQGEAASLAAREVEVYSLQVKEHHVDNTSFICDCGKGTYIRSLARDMGRKLGCLGTISVLRRLRVANFTEADAISLELLEKMLHKGNLSFLRPVESALDDILAWEIPPDQAISIRRGQPLGKPSHLPDNAVVLARSQGKAVALCNVSQGSVKPVRVFNL